MMLWHLLQDVIYFMKEGALIVVLVVVIVGVIHDVDYFILLLLKLII